MDNDKIIWDFLMRKYNNPYGVAALMGNLYVESHLSPGYVEKSRVAKLNMTPEQYMNAVNTGKYTPEQFSNDGVGFGLAQWTYHTRKESLYLYIRSNHFNWIDSLDGQLKFLCNELLSYKTVNQAILNATDVRTCSDVIVKLYEKPKNQAETFLENRAKYGRGYFDKFAKTSEIPKQTKKYVVAKENVNLRVGNGLKYGREGTLKKGEKLPYVATAENGWFAAEYKNKVIWLSNEFSRVE